MAAVERDPESVLGTGEQQILAHGVFSNDPRRVLLRQRRGKVGPRLAVVARYVEMRRVVIPLMPREGDVGGAVGVTLASRTAVCNKGFPYKSPGRAYGRALLTPAAGKLARGADKTRGWWGFPTGPGGSVRSSAGTGSAILVRQTR